MLTVVHIEVMIADDMSAPYNNVSMRMAIYPHFNSAIGNKISQFSRECTIQNTSFMLWSHNL